ncbi:ribosomal RNA-processing protein 8 isoform X2 [Siniperca chuatsi]|uniref:ribosomal RNA-processing protein 8 isoform X2 n=1 Tax=Siniperca chuatsi TaxID=119488 RepID=UPI001CE1ECB7|nr:ribosomal RNA-processing protein 8 isoform X2 [Siniperca chuatsi]
MRQTNVALPFDKKLLQLFNVVTCLLKKTLTHKRRHQRNKPFDNFTTLCCLRDEPSSGENMFNEDEDWNDEQDAQILSTTALGNTQKANSSTNVKSKVVGKKSLLRTLQTLGSVPEWKSDDHQQDSDSETEVPPSHSKKKKKRRKRPKQAETTGEQQENGDLDQTGKEEKLLTTKRKKDNKFGALKVKTTSVGKTKDKEMTESAKVNLNNPENTERLSRQQWKNKMKNKRKCKNKYSQNKPEEEVNKPESAVKHKPMEEVKTDSYSNKNSEKISQKPPEKKEHKPQKRKKTEEDTDISRTTETQTLRKEKQQIEKEKKTKGGKAEKGATESSADGSKQKADEPEVEIADDQHQLPTKRPELSKEQTLKRAKLRKMLRSQETVQQESPAETKDEPAAPEEEVKQDRSASLRSRMEQRLESARFRYINEVLYSTSSGEAKRMFKQDPQAFGIYHRGYTAQVQRWPANPVDEIISYIRLRPSSLVVADFGCGDCKIARSVKNKVHSFDLAAACEHVTVCDMANVPLHDGSVDIAVFCLSLMGTNLADFLAEANRVLKMGGVLKIAEVTSRFENVRSFVTALASLGFKMVSKDTENTHFYSFEFVKMGNAPENVKKFGLQLKPCVYKKR